MPDSRSKTALILTGGGIMGAAYEIGALTALDRLFFQGPMSSLARSQVMHQGYALTLTRLRDNYQEIAGIFARHGIATTSERLNAPPP